SEDKQSLHATTDGFVELRADRITVHPIARIAGNLPTGDHTFTGGILILGDVKGGSITANEAVAIRGVVAGATIRTRGDVILTRAARTNVQSEGNVYVLGTLLHCEINTRKKLIALDGASMIGGTLIATEGVEAAELGNGDFTETHVRV